MAVLDRHGGKPAGKMADLMAQGREDDDLILALFPGKRRALP